MGTDILKGGDASLRWLCGLVILWSVVAYARMTPAGPGAQHAQFDFHLAPASRKSAAAAPASPPLSVYLQLHETRDLDDEALPGHAKACHG